MVAHRACDRFFFVIVFIYYLFWLILEEESFACVSQSDVYIFAEAAREIVLLRVERLYGILILKTLSVKKVDPIPRFYDRFVLPFYSCSDDARNSVLFLKRARFVLC